MMNHLIMIAILIYTVSHTIITTYLMILVLSILIHDRIFCYHGWVLHIAIIGDNKGATVVDIVHEAIITIISGYLPQLRGPCVLIVIGIRWDLENLCCNSDINFIQSSRY